MARINSKSALETRRTAAHFVRSLKPQKKGATVVGLVGELGAGKTTFIQQAARTLGVRRRMPSPTFLIAREYPLPKKSRFEMLYHLDVYRISTKRELDNIQFFRILKDSRALIVIEWADRIKKYLPKHTRIIRFLHGKQLFERQIHI